MKKYILAAVALTALIGGISANAAESTPRPDQIIIKKFQGNLECYTQAKNKSNVTICAYPSDMPADVVERAKGNPTITKRLCGFEFKNETITFECQK